MAEPDPPNDAPDIPATEGAAPAEAPPVAVPRTPQFRQGLLKKLPQLTYANWTVKDNFRIDEEWSTVVNLRADALLGPLEAVAPADLRSS